MNVKVNASIQKVRTKFIKKPEVTGLPRTLILNKRSLTERDIRFFFREALAPLKAELLEGATDPLRVGRCKMPHTFEG